MSKLTKSLKKFRVHWNILTESGEYPKSMIIHYATDAEDAKEQLRKLMKPGTDYEITDTVAL